MKSFTYDEDLEDIWEISQKLQIDTSLDWEERFQSLVNTVDYYIELSKDEPSYD